MASRPSRLCSLCGAIVPYGQQCACAVERKAAAEKARPTARQRGYTRAWEQASKAFLAHPSNRLCACGCGRPADVVDHRVAHKGDKALFWNRGNWQPMNRACNSRKAAKTEGGFGNPIKDRG